MSLLSSSSHGASTVLLLFLLSLSSSRLVFAHPGSSRALSSQCRDPCPDTDCDEEPSHKGCNGNICEQICLAKGKNTRMASEEDEGIVEELKELEDSYDTLRLMVAGLYALVPIILLALVLIILKLYLPSVFKCFKRTSGPERRRPNSTQNLRELSVSTIRLANHQQSSESPRPTRISNQIPQSTPVTRVPSTKQQTSAGPPTRRTRQPSESTCPDESSETHQGYDNLGLSTSTLHNQSTSSSNRSLGTMHSTRTMNTTLPDHTPHQSLSTRI